MSSDVGKPKHKVITAQTYYDAQTNPASRISGVLEFLDGNKNAMNFGVCLRINHNSEVFFTHFHAHYTTNRNGVVTTVSSAHFKQGMSKYAQQGFDLKTADATRILNELLSVGFEEGKWIRL